MRLRPSVHFGSLFQEPLRTKTSSTLQDQAIITLLAGRLDRVRIGRILNVLPRARCQRLPPLQLPRTGPRDGRLSLSETNDERPQLSRSGQGVNIASSVRGNFPGREARILGL